MTLEQVAEAAGFGGYAYFHRVFRARYGISPGATARTIVWVESSKAEDCLE
ncbi:Bacterial regulatory helix-turn-helix protein, AraC family [compost metagenome]